MSTLVASSHLHEFSRSLKPSRALRTLAAVNSSINKKSTSTKRPLPVDENDAPIPISSNITKRVKSNAVASSPSKLNSASPQKTKREHANRVRGFGRDLTNSAAVPLASHVSNPSSSSIKSDKIHVTIKKSCKSSRVASTRALKRTEPIERVGKGPLVKPTTFSVPAMRSSLSIVESAAVPESWVFDIYEDTAEEAMQNSLTYIDISPFDESCKSEIEERGKENIPPERLAELMALEARERENAMRIEDAQNRAARIPQRKGLQEGAGKGGRVLGEHREPLREMVLEELVVLPEEKIVVLDDDKDGILAKPATSKESDRSTFPEAKKQVASSGWDIWESDHKDTTPEPPTKSMGKSSSLDFEIFSDAPSDKEN